MVIKKSISSSYEYGPNQTSYERKEQLFYIQVHPTVTEKSKLGRTTNFTDTNLITNIAIYQANTQETRYLFDKKDNKRITLFLYEDYYEEEYQKMVFNTYCSNVINNERIPKREAVDRLLMVCKNETHLEFWVCSKKGEDMKRICEAHKGVRWKLDVFSRKLLLIDNSNNQISVQDFDW